MKFEIQLNSGAGAGETRQVAAEGVNWLAALETALRDLDESLPSELSLSLTEDRVSVELHSPDTGWRVRIVQEVDEELTLPEQSSPTGEPEGAAPPRAVPPTSRPRPEPVPTPADLEIAAPEFVQACAQRAFPPPTTVETPADLEIAPVVAPDTFSMDGKYAPGMTTDFLTDAFMKVADLHGNFGANRKAALKYVLETVVQSIEFTGGGVLLTDLNDPSRELWFEAAFGPCADKLDAVRLSMDNGAVGYSAREGVGVNIPDLSTEDRFAADQLLELAEVEIGPLVCMPIQHKRRLHGAFVIFNRKGHRPFTAGEQSVLGYLSGALGEYLAELDDLSPDLED